MAVKNVKSSNKTGRSAFYYKPAILISFSYKILLPVEADGSCCPMLAPWHPTDAKGTEDREIDCGQRRWGKTSVRRQH